MPKMKLEAGDTGSPPSLPELANHLALMEAVLQEPDSDRQAVMAELFAVAIRTHSITDGELWEACERLKAAAKSGSMPALDAAYVDLVATIGQTLGLAAN
jgi:hypothetical protein